MKTSYTNLMRATLAATILTYSMTGFAGAGHYLPGLFNARDFFLPEKAGVYSSLYLGRYSADTLKDKNGSSINQANYTGPRGNSFTANLDTKLNINIIAPLLVWNSGYKVLGADYATAIMVPFTNTSVDAALNVFGNFNIAEQSFSRDKSVSTETNMGINDIFVSPVLLDWRGKHYDIITGYGFYAPTGKYNAGGSDNRGLGFWTHQLQLGGAYYPFDNQGTAITLVGNYEINQKTQGKDFTQGSHFTLNWGVSQFLPINDDVLVEVGPSGYLQWQVQANHGADQPVVFNTNNRVYGAGGQIGVAVPKMNAKVTFRYLTEFDAQARPQGDYAGLSAAVGF